MARLEFEDMNFEDNGDKIKINFLRIFSAEIDKKELEKIGKFSINKNAIEFDATDAKASKKFNFLLAEAFKNLKNKITNKKEFLQQQKTKNDLFAAEELKKAEIQEENIRKILRELYERREKKIINLALDRSRTSSNIIDTSVLLKEEKEIYDRLVALFDRFRKGILLNLLETEAPKVEIPTVKPDTQMESESSKQEAAPAEPEIDPEVEKEVEHALAEKKVKFIDPIPKFIGEDLQEYGPFETAQIITLPLTIAELLIDKGKAEETE